MANNSLLQLPPILGFIATPGNMPSESNVVCQAVPRGKGAAVAKGAELSSLANNLPTSLFKIDKLKLHKRNTSKYSEVQMDDEEIKSLFENSSASGAQPPQEEQMNNGDDRDLFDDSLDQTDEFSLFIGNTIPNLP